MEVSWGFKCCVMLSLEKLWSPTGVIEAIIMSWSWLACLWETLIHADIIAGFAINQFVLLLLVPRLPHKPPLGALHVKVMGWLSEDNGTCKDASRWGWTEPQKRPPRDSPGRKWRNKAFDRSREKAAGPLICLERFWFSWHSDSWYIKLFNSVVCTAAWIHLVPVSYD